MVKEIFSDPTYVPPRALGSVMTDDIVDAVDDIGGWGDDEDLVIQVPDMPTDVATPTPTDSRLKLECYSLTKQDSQTRLEEAKALYEWATSPLSFLPRTKR